MWSLTESTVTEEMKLAVLDVLASGQITLGPKVRAFEREFAALVGAKHTRMVNSGSSANLLAIAALRHHPTRPLLRGDVAIVPAIAWATTYSPLHQYGLRMKIVDVDPVTLNADMSAVRLALCDPEVKLIVGASILGEPAAVDGMRELADKHGIWFLEDNCESLGATIKGKHTGTFGHIGTYSTFFTHHLSTGEGGMVVTDDPVLSDLVTCLRAHGWARDLPPNSPLLAKGTTPAFGDAYRFLLPGFNLRPTEFQAALGLAQLFSFELAQWWRRMNMVNFYALPEMLSFKKLRVSLSASGIKDCSAVPFGFVLIAKTPELRARALKALDSVGIEYRMVTGGCLLEHEVSHFYRYETIGTLPHATKIHHCGFFVGNLPRDLKGEIQLLYQTLKDIV